MPVKTKREPIPPEQLRSVAPHGAPGAAVSVPVRLEDGKVTTVHIAAYPRPDTAVRVAVFDEAEPLPAWCERMQISHAIVGGFFMRGPGLPVGEVWMRGLQIESHLGPWADQRGSLYVDGHDVRIAARRELPADPTGDLIQAGPRLAANGRSLVCEGAGLDGFPKTWRHTNDTDITKGRYQRTAIGLSDDRIWAVVCDGPYTIPARLRKPSTDAGLTLGELAEVLLALGAREALNLDGGGSSSLVFDRELINRPRAGLRDSQPFGTVLKQGRAVHSAIAFIPR